MSKKQSIKNPVNEESPKHIFLECSPSPDGVGWSCKRVNSREFSRLQLETDAEDDSREPVSPAKGKTLDTHIRQNSAGRSLKEDPCGCSAGFQNGVDSETDSQTSAEAEPVPITDGQTMEETGEDDGEGGCADDEF